ncbi:MAG: HAD hydrolase-like protein [Verrucomicrobiota bacterium]
MVEKWDHLIWDWNGTLLADTGVCVSVLNEIMAEYGLPPITDDHYRATFNFPVVQFYRELGFPTEPGRFEKTSHQFIARYNERSVECPLHEGSEELLNHLFERGVSQSVLSAALQSSLEESIRVYRLEHCFEHLVGATDIFAHGKEERGVSWIESSGVDPTRALLIGDTLHDHEVANAMGVSCLLVAHGHHTAERLRESGCPVVEGFEELEAWLLS